MKMIFASEKKQAVYEFLLNNRDQYNMARTTYSQLAAIGSCTTAHSHRMIKQLQKEGYVKVILSSNATLLEIFAPEERKQA